MKTKANEHKNVRTPIVQLIVLSMILVLMQACGTDEPILLPEAQFEIEVDEDDPLTVRFINMSIGADAYEWSFGDGAGSTLTNPEHTYQTGDEYDVRLVAINEAGESSYSSFIDVQEPVKLIRYKDEIVNSVKESAGQYGSFSDNNYEFFEPAGDTETNRPLLILSPGGNYLQFTRQEELRSIGRALAKRGYTVAVIEYAQVSGQIDAKLQTYSDYYLLSIRDHRSAIRYFRQNAQFHGVDPDQIYVGGWSTGSIAALGTAYLNESKIELIEDEHAKSALLQSIETFGGFDNEDNNGVSSQPNGVIAMMGYVFDPNLIDNEVPLMLINHEKAVSVMDCQSFTGELSLAALDIPVSAYGSGPIHEAARSAGMVEGVDLEYVLMDYWDATWKECDWYPNVHIMGASSYQPMADFMYRNL